MSMRGRLGLGKGWVTFPPGSKEEKRRGEVTRQRGFKRESRSIHSICEHRLYGQQCGENCSYGKEEKPKDLIIW